MTTTDRPPAYVARRLPCRCVVHVRLSSDPHIEAVMRSWKREGLDVQAATLADMHRMSLCPHALETVTGRAS